MTTASLKQPTRRDQPGGNRVHLIDLREAERLEYEAFRLLPNTPEREAKWIAWKKTRAALLAAEAVQEEGRAAKKDQPAARPPGTS